MAYIKTSRGGYQVVETTGVVIRAIEHAGQRANAGLFIKLTLEQDGSEFWVNVDNISTIRESLPPLTTGPAL